MVGVHPLEDLAPRDVVAAAISRRMAEAPGGIDDHVFLDATNLGQRFYERFPSITAACREIGIDPARERIPVAPAAHYVCGGVPARLDGTTELAGLYAVGEVACTGVHGANRLASNSLTESVVAGTRLGRDLAWELPERVDGELVPEWRSAPRSSTVRIAWRSTPRCPATSACSAMRPHSTPPATSWKPSPEGGSGRRSISFVVGDDEHPHRRFGGRRGSRATDREPGLSPPDRLPRVPRRVARHIDVRLDGDGLVRTT